MMQAKVARRSAQRDGGPSASERATVGKPTAVVIAPSELVVKPTDGCRRRLRSSDGGSGPFDESSRTASRKQVVRCSRGRGGPAFAETATGLAFRRADSDLGRNVSARIWPSRRSTSRPALCTCRYGLRSTSSTFLGVSGEPKRPYIGLTHDLQARLDAHNAGRCTHTAGYRPWTVEVALHFADEPTAIRFERYLKSGSGRAFAKRHFG